MGLIAGVMPQEAFPRQDLTADNAAVLAMMLSNAEFLGQGHAQAERVVRFYQVGHAAMSLAGQQLTGDGQAGALDHGISIYETLALLVRPSSVPGYNFVAARQNARAMVQMEAGGLFDLLEQAETAFGAETPNTRDVVSDAAERFHPHQVRYAVCGAALARQFELTLNP